MLKTTDTESLIAAGHAEGAGSLAFNLALALSNALAENDQLRTERDAARQAAQDRQTVIDNAFARAAKLADEIAPDDDDRWFADMRGPTPANEKFVSAMAAIEPDEDEIAEAIEAAEREECERFYSDSNATLGLAQAGAL